MQAIGRTWIKGQRRVVYEAREIRRGKNKGKLEITWRKSALKFKRTLISANLVEFFEEVTA